MRSAAGRATATMAWTLIAAALVGCTSSSAGSGDSSARSAAGSHPPSGTASSIASTATQSQPARTQSQPARTTGAPDATAPPCGQTDAAAIARCLRANLGNFWSGRLNNSVDEPVFLDAPAARVPKGCRLGLTEAPAFTCRSNLSLYVNRSVLETIHRSIGDQDLVYALASIQSHEFGHVLQYTLHQPQIDVGNPTAATSRFLEQQADCLSGVWARHALAGVVRARFRAVAVRLVTLVSTNPEIRTHGTPRARVAAVDRGIASGRPQACRLVTFR